MLATRSRVVTMPPGIRPPVVIEQAAATATHTLGSAGCEYSQGLGAAYIIRMCGFLSATGAVRRSCWPPLCPSARPFGSTQLSWVGEKESTAARSDDMLAMGLFG